MELYITISSKQKLCLVFRYFKNHVSRTLVSGDISWRCVKKTCSSYVKTNSSKTKLTEIKDSHTHDPETEESLNLLDVQGRCKRKACEDLTLRPSKIIRTELSI
ncbi:unnamed protein product [Macrosiphum euphorbiae]|uniref:FLYWCH-type domain-containing protein n=1 Tax=Macrosiphum euphorbiae TaxID=13131 RepID=A0AAV0X3C5_9HEMI|nr:unnamed protein product [Macrosiphum euphorbiae]